MQMRACSPDDRRRASGPRPAAWVRRGGDQKSRARYWRFPILVNIAPPPPKPIVEPQLCDGKIRVVQRQPGGQLGELGGAGAAVPIRIVEKAARARMVDDVFARVLRRCANQESA